PRALPSPLFPYTTLFRSHFHAFVLRVARGDRDGVRLGINLNGNTLKIGLLVLRGLYRVDFDLIAVPALHVHGSVDVLQLQKTARSEEHTSELQSLAYLVC